MKKTSPDRIVAIDIFRALTMLLMIWVNDFWTLYDIPDWLGHATFDEDRLGFSDWVFPGFLYIVGLSIPFAISARQNKGDNRFQIIIHILKRSLALLAMGFFMVNLQYINESEIQYSKYVWQLVMAVGIILVWNKYPNNLAFKKVPQWVMQLLGIAILLVLALVFKGGNEEISYWMKPHWWGILGIIGWSYLFCSLIYVFVGQRMVAFFIIFLIFLLLNIAEFISFLPIKLVFIVSASHHLSIIGGIITSLLYLRYARLGSYSRFAMLLLGFAIIMIGFGFITRPEWGISKIKATPSWAAICLGISLIGFLLIYFFADLKKKTSWAKLIAPAGRSTLTCYLIPHLYYSMMALIAVSLPAFLRTGTLGLLKSLLYAMIIIFITGLFERLNIRLKI